MTETLPPDDRPVILHMLPDLAMGGGQVLLLRNLVHMNRCSGGAEFRHIVCSLGSGPMLGDYRNAGVPVHILPWRGLLGTVTDVTRLARKSKVALIHANNTPHDRIAGQLVGLALGVPVINTFHALAPDAFPWPRRPAGIGPFLRQRVTRTVNKALTRLNLSRLISVSEAVRRTQAAWLSLPPNNLTVIHNGLPNEAFAIHDDPVLLRSSLGIAGRGPVLLCVGRLVEGKGQRLLVPMMIELVARWPNACLLLAGEGEDRPFLEAMIERAGLKRNILLLGRRTDVTALMAASDIVVSASNYEGFGLAVLEAMAASRPVVALFTPALLEFAENGRTGVFVTRADPHEFAEVVDRLASDPVTAAMMARAGHMRARAFTTALTAEKMTNLYRDVLAQTIDLAKVGSRSIKLFGRERSSNIRSAE